MSSQCDNHGTNIHVDDIEYIGIQYLSNGRWMAYEVNDPTKTLVLIVVEEI